jgi:hypothetical protein
MQFFLDEIVARVVAIYLFIDCRRIIKDGLAEGKIRSFNPDLLDWSRWSNSLVYKDVSPIMYWFQIGIRAFTLMGCLEVAIFGWWRPAS